MAVCLIRSRFPPTKSSTSSTRTTRSSARPARRGYARRLRHRCVFILARDAEGRIFVHRRTPTKLVFPSLYDMFVGGVVGAGETYDEAALREAEEELGVPGLPRARTAVHVPLRDAPEHTWWSAVYEVRCDLPVHPQAEEIAWHAFLTEDELERRLGEWRVGAGRRWPRTGGCAASGRPRGGTAAPARPGQ